MAEVRGRVTSSAGPGTCIIAKVYNVELDVCENLCVKCVTLDVR